ncbi:MAG: tripartite tricarboxylate transporter substrate binding protein [Syntrophales bacterium]
MKVSRTVFGTFVMICFIFTCMFGSNANAQKFPNRPIEIIVGFSAGGGTDVSFRNIVPALEKELGVPVVIINKPGAGGVIGWNALANSKPTGYTIGSINMPAIVGSYVSGDLTIDPRNAFKFLGNTVFDANCIVISSKSKINNIKELVDYLKKNPEGLSYGATGKFSTDGLTALSIEKAADVKFRIINFKGSSEAITAVLGGHVDVVGMTVSEAGPFVKDNSLKLLGVGGDKRDADFPNAPTFKEQGFPIKINGSSRGLIMPAGADDAVLNSLRTAVKNAATSETYLATAKKTGQLGIYTDYNTVMANIQEQIEWLKKSLSTK